MLPSACSDYLTAHLVHPGLPGSGPRRWQLLGRRNKSKPALRVCDFRQAHGVCVLYDDYTARYAGLARGTGGIGGRLRTHVKQPPHSIAWTRFSWFSFDDVVADPKGKDGWETVAHRGEPAPTDSEAVIREVEALIITLLGTPQNDMKFQMASRWQQLPNREADEMATRAPSIRRASPSARSTDRRDRAGGLAWPGAS